MILAAGGVVWLPACPKPLIAVVHRPRYDDWSLPKGKLARGEHPLAAAVREIREETSIDAVPHAELPSTRYLVKGSPKLVRYWAMRAVSWRDRPPDAEVDTVVWATVEEAVQRLTHQRDLAVVRAFSRLPTLTSVVALVCHAHSVASDLWPGEAAASPLTARGQAQAARAAAVLDLLRPTRVVSATPARCQATVAPLAARVGLPVEVVGGLDSGSWHPSQSATSALLGVVGGSQSTVVCAPGVPTGTGWLLALSGEDPVAVSSLDDV